MVIVLVTMEALSKHQQKSLDATDATILMLNQ